MKGSNISREQGGGEVADEVEPEQQQERERVRDEKNGHSTAAAMSGRRSTGAKNGTRERTLTSHAHAPSSSRAEAMTSAKRRPFSSSGVFRLRERINRDTQWDVIIPASFFAASAVCWVDPSAAPSILFALLALGTVFVSPVVTYFTRPATEGLTGTLTDAINTITDERYSDQRDRFFDAVAELISKSVQSEALRNVLKETLMTSLMDSDLHDAALDTIQASLIKASENEDFRKTALDVVKQAFVGALNDEDFVRDLMSSIVGAMVQASKEEELTQSVLDVVTRAVSQALADEGFTNELRGAVKDTLRDGDLYKAGAKGMLSAAFGQAKEIEKSFRKSS